MRVAIIGRPNVGKSTLFNRLVGRRVAIVNDRPGVTRDYREGQGRIHGCECTIIDTAGYESGSGLVGDMTRMTETAIAAADICLFLFDGRAGVVVADEAAVSQGQRFIGIFRFYHLSQEHVWAVIAVPTIWSSALPSQKP